MEDNFDKKEAGLIFWKYLTFRDVLILALIISNVFLFVKLKDYNNYKQAAINGNAAAQFIQNQINVQNAQNVQQ